MQGFAAYVLVRNLAKAAKLSPWELLREGTN